MMSPLSVPFVYINQKPIFLLQNNLQNKIQDGRHFHGRHPNKKHNFQSVIVNSIFNVCQLNDIKNDIGKSILVNWKELGMVSHYDQVKCILFIEF